MSNTSNLIIRGLRSEAEDMFAGEEVSEVLWARSFRKWAFAIHTARTASGRTELFARAALTAYLTGRIDYRPGRDEGVVCNDVRHAEVQMGDLMDALL